MARQSQKIKTTQQRLIELLEQGHVDSLKHTRIFLNKNTLRLTRDGANIFKKHYTHYSFKNELNTSGDTVLLLRKMKSPYYTTPKKLVLFTEVDAFMCKLAGTKGWIKSK